MSRILVAGVDTSTQSTKVRVTDAETGKLVRFGQARHPDGTSCDPNAWWEAFLEAKDQAGGLDDVAALAVGGQQHGMVLLDRQGRVVRDALLWNDTRSAPDAERLIAELGVAGKAADGSEDDLSDDATLRGRQRWVRAVGSSLVASLTITKIAWVAANEPDNAARVAAICLPHDWLSWRIAGHGPVADDAADDATADLAALFTDRSDASGTGYFDSATNAYRMDLFKLAFGRDDVTLPRVLGPTATGAVADPSVAGRDVPGGCIIAPGGGDNAMASLGLNMGVGDVSISLGTSGVAAAVSPVPAYDMTASVTGFADCTGHWLPLACTINGSRIADAGRAALGVSYDELADLAAQSVPGAEGVTLIPYFDGERTPNRPDATATLHGMTLKNTTKANIARAFVEGLLCSQRDCLELVRGLGVDVKRILLIGGGARSAAVRAYAPGIFGMDVVLPATDEYVAIGAARQAAWVLSGEAEPPAWPLSVDGTLTGEPTPEVYEQYARYRG
ncbi:xylulose kinase [Bifidobacterium sp. 82T10]|uniref:Xylulose kinase n=1 Tax=Bifidobacterium miconis TaxID=2834435 RepID=A0ABS6WD32_9BIFI|nr:FGGY family carbohydrate kinase [Bifidobacterium miconis]MBW3091862.1 xylulose kinase [Bifidobacterium miconis]